MQQEAQQKSGGQEQEPLGPCAVFSEQKPQSSSSVQGINGQHIPGEQHQKDGRPIGLREVVLAHLPDDVVPPPLDVPDLPAYLPAPDGENSA